MYQNGIHHLIKKLQTLGFSLLFTTLILTDQNTANTIYYLEHDLDF